MIHRVEVVLWGGWPLTRGEARERVRKKGGKGDGRGGRGDGKGGKG